MWSPSIVSPVVSERGKRLELGGTRGDDGGEECGGASTVALQQRGGHGDGDQEGEGAGVQRDACSGGGGGVGRTAVGVRGHGGGGVGVGGGVSPCGVCVVLGDHLC